MAASICNDEQFFGQSRITPFEGKQITLGATESLARIARFPAYATGTAAAARSKERNRI
jgi:hypothetical protein